MAVRGVVRDGAFAFAGQVASAVGVLVNVRVLTEFLEPRAYGLMVLVIGIASSATAVLVWPLAQGALVTFAQFRAVGAESLFRQFVLHRAKRVIAVVGAGLCIVGAAATWWRYRDWIPGAFLGVLFALEAGRHVSMTLMMAAREQRRAAIIYAADSWLRLVCAAIALLLFGGSVRVAMAGTVIGAGLLMAGLRRASWARDWSAAPPPDDPIIAEIEREVMRRARPLVPAAILTNINEMTGRYVVALGTGLASAGIFTAASSLVRRPFGMLNSVTDWSLKPAIAAAAAEGEQVKTRSAMRAWIGVGVGGALLLALLVVLLREPLVRLLLAAEYRSATSILPWIVVGLLFLNASTVLNGISLVLGDAKVTLISSAAAAVATVVATFVLVAQSGLLGAAIAVAVAYGIQLIVSVVLAWRDYRRSGSSMARRASDA